MLDWKLKWTNPVVDVRKGKSREVGPLLGLCPSAKASAWNRKGSLCRFGLLSSNFMVLPWQPRWAALKERRLKKEAA